MPARIGRSGNIGERIFPPLTPALYGSEETPVANPDQLLARKLLELAHASLTWRQALLGWALDETGQIARLLHCHSLAFEAELTGQWDRSDFFWERVLAGVKSLVQSCSNNPMV